MWQVMEFVAVPPSSPRLLADEILFNLGTSNSPLSYPEILFWPLGLGSNGLPVVGYRRGVYVPPNIYANPANMPAPYVYLYSTQMQYSSPGDWVLTWLSGQAPATI